MLNSQHLYFAASLGFRFLKFIFDIFTRFMVIFANNSINLGLYKSLKLSKFKTETIKKYKLHDENVQHEIP